MAVRVPVRVCYRGTCASTSALVNSGYETAGPEILLPRRLAEYLGLTETRGEAVVYESPFGYYRLLYYHSAFPLSR